LTNYRPHKPQVIRAVLFDFDGTLTLPGAIPFSAIKAAVGCPEDMPVLEFIDSLPEGSRKRQALDFLDREELNAARFSYPNAQAEETVACLKLKRIPVGIITRNRYRTIERAMENFREISIRDFDLIVSRDDPIKPKPHPEGILFAAHTWGVDPENILVVGDFRFDIEAGIAAGAPTVYIDHECRNPDIGADHIISSIEALKEIIEMGMPLPPGKLPNAMLETFLSRFNFSDPSVLIHPGIGEDTAAVRVDGEEVLVIKTDPITFVTQSLGQYAVIINANDIATSGATPRWLLTSLLFPPETTPNQIWEVMSELERFCKTCKITLCGGHTEITDAVTRPVVTGMLSGTVLRKDLIEKRRMCRGDQILLTKAVAVEGTAIIACELRNRLLSLGMPETEIERSREFLSHISIVAEAKIAAGSGFVSAMHDITEGGLATAVKEFSIAGGHKVLIEMDRIPVFPETRRLSKILDFDPLGLIGSGSLLICCRKEGCDLLLSEIQRAGIAVCRIGEVLEEGRGVEAVKGGKKVDWPCFRVDELARIL
jgi:HAD superfamily hydrolase (TIGR01549 family)